MSDYFGSLLGLSSTGAIRPRVPSLYEPIGPEDIPMTEETVTPPSTPRPAAPPIEAPHAETEANVVALIRSPERHRISRAEDPVVAHVASTHFQAVPVAGQPVRPPAGLTTLRPAGAAPQPPDITHVRNNTNVVNVSRPVHNSVVHNSVVHNSVEHHSVENTTSSNNHRHNQTVESRINHVHEGPKNTTHQHFSAPRPQPGQARLRREPPSAPSEPVVRVSIGRIEVTAEPAAAAPVRRGRKPRPETKSLASYLAERDGGPA